MWLDMSVECCLGLLLLETWFWNQNGLLELLPGNWVSRSRMEIKFRSIKICGNIHVMLTVTHVVKQLEMMKFIICFSYYLVALPLSDNTSLVSPKENPDKKKLRYNGMLEYYWNSYDKPFAFCRVYCWRFLCFDNLFSTIILSSNR